ncbi:hypothetical protein [Streptomyces sp. NPDC002402]
MSTITAPAIPDSRRADPVPARTTAPYENWRPPVIGVSLLVPVGPDALVVADLLGSLMMPNGSVHDGQTPEQAARDVLRGAPDSFLLLRRVALARVQMRRRTVITHVLATAPMTREAARHLIYRDPRAEVHVLPTMRLIDDLPPRARQRVLVGLQALATGQTAYLEEGVVHASPPPDLLQE